MRYPVLWERVAPQGLATADWAWTDERLALLRAADIRPIATLLHHGSGPRTTHLLDPAFPEHSRPTQRRWRPGIPGFKTIRLSMNRSRLPGSVRCMELVSASAGRSRVCQALLHEVCATVLGMARIREITPAARLIQTEDAGRTYSTPTLTKQAEFENHRRWLTFDFLTGVCPRLSSLGLADRTVARVARSCTGCLEHPCPPDTVGSELLPDERSLPG